MKEIFAHEYTFTPMEKPKDRMGILAVRVEVVTDSRESEPFFSEEVLRFFDNSLNVQHKIVLEGFLNE